MQTTSTYKRTITIKKYMITKTVATGKTTTTSSKTVMSVAGSNIPSTATVK